MTSSEILRYMEGKFLLPETEFTFKAKGNARGYVSNKAKNAVDFLLGNEGLCEQLGVDVKIDKRTVEVVDYLGKDTEILIKDTKNLSDFSMDDDMDVVTKLIIHSKGNTDSAKEEINSKYLQEREEEQYRKDVAADIAYEQRQRDKENKIKRENTSYHVYADEKRKKRQQARLERQAKSQNKKNEIKTAKENAGFTVYVDSPRIDFLSRVYVKQVQYDEAKTPQEAIEWGKQQFCGLNRIDYPFPKFKMSVVDTSANKELSQLHVGDTAILRVSRFGGQRRARVTEIRYDPILKEVIELTFNANLNVTYKMAEKSFKNTQSKLAEYQSESDLRYMHLLEELKILGERYDEEYKSEVESLAREVQQDILKVQLDNELERERWNNEFNTKLEPFRSEARTAIEQFNQRSTQLSNQITSVEQRANQSVANAISQFNSNKEETARRINDLTNQFNNDKSEIEQSIDRLDYNMQRQIDEVITSNHETASELEHAKSKLSEADSKFITKATFTQNNNEFANSIQQLSNQNDEVSSKVNLFKQTVDAQFSKIGNLSELSNGTLISTVNEAKDTAEQSNRDIRAVVTDLNVTKSNLNSVVATANQQSTKISDLTSKLNQTNNAVSEVKQTAREQSTNISNINRQLNTTNTDLSNVSQTARAIETALTSGVTGADIPTKINKFIEKKTSEGIYTTLSNSVGGRNYIRDYSMKNLVNKFMKLWDATNWTFEAIVDNTAKSGYHIKATCLKAAVGSNGFHYPLFDLRGSEFQGKKMTWSIDIKSSRNLNFNNLGFEVNGLRSADVTTNWQRVTNTFNVNFLEFWSFVFYSNQIQSGDVIYIRDAQLEDGVIATTARAAEDDFKSELAEYKQTAAVNSAKLSDVIAKANTTATNLTTVEQTATRTLEELSTFKQTVNSAGYVNQTSMNNAINNTASGLRQEISRVEQSIDNKGFITTTAATQLVNAKADEYSRELATVKKSIPKDFSGNLLLDSNRNWRTNSYESYTYQLAEKLVAGQTYTMVIRWWVEGTENRGKYKPILYYNGGYLYLTGPLDKKAKSQMYYDGQMDAWYATFKVLELSEMTPEQRRDYEKNDKYIKVYRYGSSSGLVSNDNTSQAYTGASFATLVKGSIALSKWQKSWSELDSNLTTLNTFKQNTEGTLLRYESTNNEQNRKIASIESGLNGINLSVQTVSNKVASVTNNLNSTNTNLNNLASQVVKHSEVNVTDNGVSIGSKQILNGQTLTSMITVNPNNVKVISDNMVLTNQSNNLLATIDTDIYCNKRDTTSNIIISEKIKNGDKFLLKFKGYKQTSHRVNVLFYITYTDNTHAWLPIRIDDKPVIKTVAGKVYYDFETDYTLTGLDNNKTIRDFRMGYQIDASSNFGIVHVEKAELYQKRDASLVVDGSITAKQLNVKEIFAKQAVIDEIKSNLIKTKALEATTVKIVEKLVIGEGDNPGIVLSSQGNSFIEKLESRLITAKKINTLHLDAGILKAGTLASKNGTLRFNLDKNVLETFGNQSVIRRLGKGLTPNQFIKMNGYDANRRVMMSLGSNRRTASNHDNENENDGGFVGIKIWNGMTGVSDYYDNIDIIADVIEFTDKANPEPRSPRRGWIMRTYENQYKQIIEPFKSDGYSRVEATDFWILNKAGNSRYSIRQALRDIFNQLNMTNSIITGESVSDIE